LIRKSLKRTVFSVAKLRLPDQIKDHREIQESRKRFGDCKEWAIRHRERSEDGFRVIPAEGCLLMPGLDYIQIRRKLFHQTLCARPGGLFSQVVRGVEKLIPRKH